MVHKGLANVRPIFCIVSVMRLDRRLSLSIKFQQIFVKHLLVDLTDVIQCEARQNNCCHIFRVDVYAPVQHSPSCLASTKSVLDDHPGTGVLVVIIPLLASQRANVRKWLHQPRTERVCWIAEQDDGHINVRQAPCPIGEKRSSFPFLANRWISEYTCIMHSAWPAGCNVQYSIFVVTHHLCHDRIISLPVVIVCVMLSRCYNWHVRTVNCPATVREAKLSFKSVNDFS